MQAEATETSYPYCETSSTRSIHLSGKGESPSLPADELRRYEQTQSTVCTAAWNNNLRVLQGLVEQVRRGDNMAGYGPTHFAASLGNVEILEFLLQNGIDKNERDRDGNSALMWVVASDGKEELLDSLVDHGANVNIQNFVGETALFIAAQRGYTDKVAFLLENGASANVQTIDGASPLHAAAANGHAGIVALLVSNGAYINAGDNEGDTALHWAVREAKAEAAVRLVQLGANINASNEDGESPLDLALCLEDKTMVNCLAALGAKRTDYYVALDMGGSCDFTTVNSEVLGMSLDMKDLYVHKPTATFEDGSASFETGLGSNLVVF